MFIPRYIYVCMYVYMYVYVCIYVYYIIYRLLREHVDSGFEVYCITRTVIILAGNTTTTTTSSEPSSYAVHGFCALNALGLRAPGLVSSRFYSLRIRALGLPIGRIVVPFWDYLIGFYI